MPTPIQRALRVAAALGVAGALAAGAVPQASVAAGAESPAAGAQSPAAGPKNAPPGSGEQRSVTLITGDRVLLQPGRPGASVLPGPGRTGLTFNTFTAKDHHYVVPSDAAPLIERGLLDRRLFDLTALVDAGYDDARRGSLPVLVTYRSGVPASARSKAPAGSRVTRALPSISGTAVTAEKSALPTFWAGITGRARAKSAEIKKVWLDGRVRASLDRSVPQIGAPTAWQAGYTGKGVKLAVIDTGVDETHPDLAGRQLAEQNFSEAEDAVDRAGHGTHVASTAAGTGAGSGGKYRGVAPEAGILDAKVLDDSGFGTDSGIIAGMEWAAQQGADIANVSLGGRDDPGIDPMEEAVNRLSAQYGTLFVVAAGNDGPGRSTLGSPGTADAALTVGAVDRDDKLAGFSSRGPRLGDRAIKPDITAPGVDIVAARSGSADLEPAAEDGYTAMSGTSMATPHVAGAAALVAQQHPSLSGRQLKRLLMASAKPTGGAGVFGQGAGRVDAARAITQTVTAEPPSINLGVQQWPHDDDVPVREQVTFSNAGDEPVTLELRVDATGPDSKPAPADMFALSTASVTVPAGGTASVTVSANTRNAPADGDYTGSLVATGSGSTVRVPVAVNREVESYDVTLKNLDRTGAATGDYDMFVISIDERTASYPYDPDGSLTVRLPRGRHMVQSRVRTGDGTDLLAYPNLVVDRDTTITLDARKARPLRVTTPAPAAKFASAAVVYTRTVDVDFRIAAGLFVDGGRLDRAGSAHLGPALPVRELTAISTTDWTDQAATSYYGLAWVQRGKVPTGLNRDGSKEKLATVELDYGKKPADPIFVASGALPRFEEGTVYGIGREIPDTKETAYFSTAGVEWQHRVVVPAPKGDLWTTFESPPRTYQAGKRYIESYNQPVYGPALPVSRFEGDWVVRQGDSIFAWLPLFGDAAGNSGLSSYDTRETRLWRNGVEVTVPGDGWWEVGPGLADYRITSEVDRSSGYDLSTKVGITWTFRSDTTSTSGYTRLPISTVRYFPKLDGNGSAPAGGTFTFPVGVQEQGSNETRAPYKLTAEVSYDAGKTWQAAKVTAGNSRLTVQHPADPTATVSLRSKATDGNGNTVEQTIIDAYRLR